MPYNMVTSEEGDGHHRQVIVKDFYDKIKIDSTFNIHFL